MSTPLPMAPAAYRPCTHATLPPSAPPTCPQPVPCAPSLFVPCDCPAPATPTAAPRKKAPPSGTIPPGPWYQVAWLLLTDAERHRLTYRTRSGKALPPLTADYPVQALSAPGKMPGYSWAITAGRTCPGAVYGPDAICGPDYATHPLLPGETPRKGCYAGGTDHGEPTNPSNLQRGYITRTVVRRALLVREQFARITTATPSGRATFAAHMVQWITANTDPADPFFRVHDSGDFFSPSYIDAWVQVIAATPSIRYWAPTRSWHIARDKGGRWAASFAALNLLPNTAIRPSALQRGDDAPALPGWAAGSGVKAEGWNCPASTTNNECQSCRACWSPETAIYYHWH